MQYMYMLYNKHPEMYYMYMFYDKHMYTAMYCM